ncbi:MAG: hypothetical protein KDI30_04385, partial [Pseudomonadales bacterium]|nr:hypothetical protein [Pseudomonadales bacterium]
MGLRNLRVKSVALLSLLFTIAFSSQVWSIGLGEINLKSPLNAPLDAEIHLLQVNDLGENEILVNLAPQADFDRAGVPRRFFLRNIKFKLDLNNEKGPLIKVFSHEAIQEPYLNFIVEVMWPNDRLLREYVVLMDLPAVDGSGIARPVRVNRQKQLSDDELMADIPEKYKVSASAAKRTSSSV